MNYWIDERGRLWPGDCFQPQHDGFVVSAFGLVKLVSRGSNLTVSFAPEQATRRAIQATREILGDAHSNQIITLRYYLGGWATETHYGPAASIVRFNLLTGGSVAVPEVSVRLEQGNPRWDLQAMPLIAGLASFWEQRSGILSLEEPMVQAAMSKGVVFTRPKGQFGFSWIGAESMFRTYLGEAVSKSMIGRSYRQAPGGPDFQVAAKTYGKAMDRWRPRYDRVHTLFAQNPREPIWFHYQRLLLPIRQNDREDGLLVLCEETPHLPMPFVT